VLLVFELELDKLFSWILDKRVLSERGKFSRKPYIKLKRT